MIGEEKSYFYRNNFAELGVFIVEKRSCDYESTSDDGLQKID